jgi:hypothetical protein
MDEYGLHMDDYDVLLHDYALVARVHVEVVG